MSEPDTLRQLDEFLASVESRAFGMAMVATMNRADALDIVQEAMLKLAESYRHKSADQWPPLFHRILQHAITDWHRRQSRQKRWFQWWHHSDEDELNPVAQAPAPVSEQPEQRLEQQRYNSAIHQALHRLPLRQQQAFLLRHWEGLDVEQTARAMGCSSGSVKTHYSRATQNLRQTLEELQS